MALVRKNSDEVVSSARLGDAASGARTRPAASQTTYELHMHNALPSIPVASGNVAPRQRGPGAVVGQCVVCCQLVLETKNTDGWRACSSACGAPLVAHTTCAMDAMLSHGVDSLRQNCGACNGTLSIEMEACVLPWRRLLGNALSPHFWLTLLFRSAWRAAKALFFVWGLLVLFGILYKWAAWISYVHVETSKYYNNPAAYGNKPLRVQSFGAYTVKWNVGTLVWSSTGWSFDTQHLSMGFSVLISLGTLFVICWVPYRAVLWLFGLGGYRRRLFYVIKPHRD